MTLEHIESFVKGLRLKGAFIAPWLEDAVRQVPRHHFIERYYDDKGNLVRFSGTHEQLKMIYSNSCLTIRKPPSHSAASEPCLVMWMLADLDAQPDHKILEIGTGSGWNAGLLAFRAKDGNLIYTIDAQPDLVEEARVHLAKAGIKGVNLRAGDGGLGWPEAAPFDRIVATVGCPDIPPAWHEQLADGGMLLVPLKTAGIGDPVIRLTRKNGRLIGGFSRWSYFATLQGGYWSDAEDVLQEPFEPWLETLLQQNPRLVPLSEIMTNDCLFFLRLKGLHVQRMQGKPGYMHGESKSVFSPDTQSPVLGVYGDYHLGSIVSEYQNEWIDLRRPKITDYLAELVGPEATCGYRSWLDKRTHACLRFSLPKNWHTH